MMLLLIQKAQKQNIIIITSSFPSSFLSFCHEKATKALYLGQIQTRLEVVFVSEFSD